MLLLGFVVVVFVRQGVFFVRGFARASPWLCWVALVVVAAAVAVVLVAVVVVVVVAVVVAVVVVMLSASWLVECGCQLLW